MLTAKQLLIKQTTEAFRGRPDMPLMASLEGITDEEASWRPDENLPTIEQIVRHIGWAKSRFCEQGFGTPMVLIDLSVNDDGDSPDLPWEFPCGAAWGCKLAGGIAGAIELLEKAHRVLTECLESCAEESLEKPIPTNHGKSAANFFWVMLMHDLYHAGQIRTRRTIFQVQTRPS
jgi:DinB superfamily